MDEFDLNFLIELSIHPDYTVIRSLYWVYWGFALVWVGIPLMTPREIPSLD
jgi:hypothetical protein